MTCLRGGRGISAPPDLPRAGDPGGGALPAPERTTLRARLRRAERRQKLRALGLIAPLFVFLGLNFVLPIGLMLFRAVDDREVRAVFPQTVAALRDWDGRALPGPTVVATFVAELAKARGGETFSLAANRLNFDINGFRTLLLRTGRQLPPPDAPDLLKALITIDARWGERESWGALKRARGPFTSFYLLRSVDLATDAIGEVRSVPQDQAIFRTIFLRTIWISLVVTTACLILSYPVAYLLATLPPSASNLLMICVLLPFWTSALVRTTAWIVLLQTNGVVNGVLHWAGVISQPLRLIYNRIGVNIAMTHVLLPFMILPLYSVMKGIGPTSTRAAVSLGAHPFVAFLRVYLPQTAPGIGAGTLLVFISAIGFYITPALVGGADDQMISYFIAFYTNQTLNWGMAGALGLVLLVATLALYAVYSRLTGAEEPGWR